MNIYIVFIISLVGLIYGSNLIIDNSKLIALKFNISKLVIGITVIAFGTSLPELIVGILSSLQDKGDIAISNVIGSNIANIGLVLGTVVFIKPIAINVNEKLSFNLFYCLFSTFFFIVILYLFNGVFFKSGLLLLVLFLLYMYYLFSHYSRDNDFVENNSQSFYFLNIVKLLVGFVLLAIGTEYFIQSVVEISSRLGFNNNVAISMSLVAFGTSVPELITSLVAIFKKEKALAVGNIVGSNIFNILLVSGMSSIVNSILIDFTIIKYHLILLLLITLFFIISVYAFKRINRITSFVFISTYFVFLYINFS